MIEWQPSMNVGVSKLDEQHQNLASMVNELFVVMEAKKDRGMIEEKFQAFLLYTFQHFDYEESLFKNTNYAEAEVHEKEHEKLRVEAMELKQRFDENKTGMTPVEVLNYLRNWLLQHIDESDRQFARYYLGHGIPESHL